MTQEGSEQHNMRRMKPDRSADRRDDKGRTDEKETQTRQKKQRQAVKTF